MRGAWPLLLCSWGAACGGHARTPFHEPPESAGLSGAGGEAGELIMPSAGRAPTDQGEGGAGGEPAATSQAGEAGAGGSQSRPHLPVIEPGTRTCLDSRDCFGLTCFGKEERSSQLCSVSCDEDSPCASGERCIAAPGLMPLCLKRCMASTDCPYPLDCFDPDRDQQFVCVPAPWTLVW